MYAPTRAFNFYTMLRQPQIMWFLLFFPPHCSPTFFSPSSSPPFLHFATCLCFHHLLFCSDFYFRLWFSVNHVQVVCSSCFLIKGKHNIQNILTTRSLKNKARHLINITRCLLCFYCSTENTISRSVYSSNSYS